MAYFDIAALTTDPDFIRRCTASAATEGKGTPEEPPQMWTANRIWDICATPGFGDKYAYAIANNVPEPGKDQAVISDAEILAAIQPMT